jgi:hypothetical protein
MDVETTFWISSALLAGAVFLYMGGRSAGMTRPFEEGPGDGDDEASFYETPSNEGKGTVGAGGRGTVPAGASSV